LIKRIIIPRIYLLELSPIVANAITDGLPPDIPEGAVFAGSGGLFIIVDITFILVL
jgi:hypothetical protein